MKHHESFYDEQGREWRYRLTIYEFFDRYIFTLPMLFASLMVLFFLAMVADAVHEREQLPYVYAAYCKVNACGDLTLEEFKTLKNAGLLAGQPRQGLSVGEAAAIGAAAGVATGVRR